jgi:NTE family protein
MSDIIEVMNSLDYGSLRDGTTLDRLGFPGKALQLLLAEGIYKGDVAAEWIRSELAKVGVHTWADLRIEDPDTALEPYQQYRLVIMASDLSRGQLVRLPWDYRHYGLDPDEQPVAEAVRASMSIPFFFRPVTLRTGPGSGGDVTLVDGGMLSNFPVETFDRTDDRAPRWPTFGVKLSARAASRQQGRHIDGPFDLALACLHTLLQAHDAYHLEDTGATRRTMFVDTEGVSSVDFDIDPQTRERLFVNGRKAARTFLEGIH